MRDLVSAAVLDPQLAPRGDGPEQIDVDVGSRVEADLHEDRQRVVFYDEVAV